MAYNSTSWTTDANTKSGSTGTNTVGGVTLYKEFGLYDYSPIAGVHNAMSSMNSVPINSATGFQSNNNSDAFGNGTDPATSVDLDDATGNRFGIINGIWFIEDNIKIDKIRAIATADGSQAINFHVMSYDMDVTSNYGDLSNGTLIAHINSSISVSDTTLKTDTLAIDSASIAANKVVIAFAEAETNTNDITCRLIIKYHLI